MLHTTGQRIGQYVLGEQLGAGGMAEVWSASHQILGVSVAIKLLRRRSEPQQQRLIREGRVQAALDHPNILPVRDVVEDAGVLGLVMPLVAGPTLAQLLASRRLSEAEAAALLRPVVSGVAHAHASGLVHRDLKPGNILLSPSRGRLVPRVSDFGLVRDALAPGGTRTGAVMGTLRYAAPEQLLDAARADARADLFSLGVVLVELLTGRLPFTATSLRSLLSAYSAGPRLDGVPGRWVPLCRALLAEEPADRLASCAELLSALDALQPPDDAVLGPRGGLLEEAERLWAGSRAGSRAGSTVTALSAVSSLEETGSWPAPSAPSHNLSEPLDGFVGRQPELSALAARLPDSRLVSVLGPGGVGKTRLVQELGRQQLSSFPGGVWFCDLSEARSAEQLAAAVAGAMGVVLERGAPLERVGRAISGRGRCLILLDNFEQIAGSCAEVVAGWVAQAAEARFVVTSRVLLGVSGEAVVPLEPLDEDAAVALFEARAQARRPSWRLDGHREAVAELVRLLDGLPLAVELAAARIALMGPEKMVARMGQRFKLLQSRRGRGRQATLRGAIDWSWDLLADWERAAFAQCSAFEGSFTLEAAEAVLDLSGFTDDTGGEPWPMDAVQGLVERSLLSAASSSDGEARFRMLLSLQAYAAEKLASSGLTGEVYARHAALYAELGEADALEALRRRGGDARWWALLQDRPNLEAAIQRALDLGEGETAAHAALALAAVARQQGPYGEAAAALGAVARHLSDSAAGLRAAVRTALGGLLLQKGDTAGAQAALEAALADAEQPRLEAEARLRLCDLCVRQGRLDDAAQHVQRAAEVAEQRRDQHLLGRALMSRCSLNSVRGASAKIEPDAVEALRLLRAVGDRRAEGAVLRTLANLSARTGKMARAVELHRQALAIHRETGSRQQEAVVLCSLGPIYAWESRTDEAEQVLRRALQIARVLGSRDTEARALGFMGTLHRKLGQYDRAEACLQGALAIHRETGSRRSLAIWVGNLANVYLSAGRLAEAEACYREAADTAAEIGNPSVEANVLSNLSELLTRQGRFDEATETAQRSLSLARRSNNRIFEALTLGNLGGLYARQGRSEQAREHLLLALDRQREIGNRSAEATLRRALGELDLDCGRIADAERNLEAALGLARDIAEPSLEGSAMSALGALRAAQGRYADGRALQQQAEERLRPLNELTLLVTLLVGRAELELRAGCAAASEGYQQQARAMGERLGMQPDAEVFKRLDRLAR